MRLAVAVLAGLMLLGLAVPAAAADPQVSIPEGAHEVDQLIEVSVSGWPAGVITVAVCGQRAERGSADCALGTSQTVNVGPDGTGQVDLRAVEPAAGCPCVIRASTLTSAEVVTTDLSLAGVPEVPRPPEPVEQEPEEAEVSPLSATITVERSASTADRLARLVGTALWLDLTVTVENPAEEPSPGQSLRVIAGRNSTGGETVATVDVPELAAGERHEAPLRTKVDVPVIGRYVLFVVSDEADAADGPLVEKKVESWPVISMVLVLFAAAWLASRRRSRSVGWAAMVTAASMGVLVLGRVLAT